MTLYRVAWELEVESDHPTGAAFDALDVLEDIMSPSFYRDMPDIVFVVRWTDNKGARQETRLAPNGDGGFGYANQREETTRDVAV